MSVLARTMQVLDVLAEAPAPVALTDLSRATDLPLTTVHRLCAELLAENAIERAVGGGFQLGGKLWDLGRRYGTVERLRGAAMRYLHDLHEVTRATVELVQLVGDGLFVVERLPAPEAVPLEWRTRLGRISFETSAAGLAILAQTTPKASRPYMSRDAEEALSAARGTGVVRLPDRSAPDRVVLAVAIGSGHTAPGAGAGAVVVHVSGEQAVRSSSPSLVVTARRIAAALTV